MGGGYELDEAYPNMDFCFLDIGNIHVMRERYNMMCTLGHNTNMIQYVYSRTSVIRTLQFHHKCPDYRGFHFKEVCEY